MAWHFRSGYAIFTLLAFRLVWGFVGGRWSRFAHFRLRAGRRACATCAARAGPTSTTTSATRRSARCRCSPCSPCLSAQVASGLVADDEIASTGPLVRFVSGADQRGGDRAGTRTTGQWIIIGLVALHVAAVLFYAAARRQNLVGADAARRQAARRRRAAVDRQRRGSRLLALAIAAVCAAVVGLDRVSAAVCGRCRDERPCRVIGAALPPIELVRAESADDLARRRRDLPRLRRAASTSTSASRTSRRNSATCRATTRRPPGTLLLACVDGAARRLRRASDRSPTSTTPTPAR